MDEANKKREEAKKEEANKKEANNTLNGTFPAGATQEESKKREVTNEEEKPTEDNKRRKVVEEQGESSSRVLEKEERKNKKRSERDDESEEKEGGEERGRKKLLIGSVRSLKEIRLACPTPHEEAEEEKVGVEDDMEWGETCDSLTGGILDPKLVTEARREEVDYIEETPVYLVVDEAESWEKTGRPPTSAKCVNVNKGSDDVPEVRCRWVARDSKPKGEKDREDLFADMPPVEAKRM